jgi:hypothetical protein
MTRVNARRWLIGLGALCVLFSWPISAREAMESGPRQHRQPLCSVLIVPELAILLVAGTAGGLFVGVRALLSSRYRSAANLLQGRLNGVSDRLAAVERQDVARHLSNQKGFLGQFKGESLKLYQELVSAVRELRARLHALDRRLNHSRHVLEKSGEFPSMRALRKATRLIASDKLTFEAVLFPGQLPSTMSDLPAGHAQVAESLIASIAVLFAKLQTAINDCRRAETDVNEAVEAVNRQYQAFLAAGFGPVYQQDLTELEEERRAFLREMTGDPLAAGKNAQSLCEQSRSLRDELTERLICKRELESAVQEEICQLEGRIASVRAQKVVNSFPAPPADPAGDHNCAREQVEPVADENFKLCEPNADLDLLVTRARDSAGEAIRLVLALPRSSEACSERRRRSGRGRPEAEYVVRQRAVRQTISDAGRLIDRTLSAKARIEEEATDAYKRLDDLRKSLDYASPVKQRLMEIGRESTWQAEADSFRTAEQLLIGRELETVRSEYLSQNYLSGLERIESLLERINQSIAAVQRAEARLNQLKKHKRSARESVSSLRDRERALAEKLSKNSFTTSRETAEAVQALVGQIDRLEAAVAVECEDWLQLDKDAQRCADELRAADEQIAQQQKEYEKAVDKLDSLALVVSEARQSCSPECTRRLARTRLADASKRYDELKQAIAVGGANWCGLQAEIEEVKRLAREATKAGTADSQSFDRASRMIEQATLKQKRLGKHASGASISEKMRVANQALLDAQANYKERAWEEAERYASQADTSYRGALNARGY